MKASSDKARRPIGRRPSHEGRKTFWLVVSGASLLGFLGVAHTWARLGVLEREYQISAAQAESVRLASEAQKLRMEVDSYASETPISVTAPALAMKKATVEQVVRVTAGLASASVSSAKTLAANERP